MHSSLLPHTPTTLPHPFPHHALPQVDYEFPAHATISDSCKDLIRRILVANPSQRLSLKQIQARRGSGRRSRGWAGWGGWPGRAGLWGGLALPEQVTG